jgi:hypothetical protein
MKWRKRVSIKVFWVGVAIALALVLLLASNSPKEKFDTIAVMVGGFVIGFVTYAIATKVYKL